MGKQTCANNILMHALRIMVALLCIALTRVCEAIRKCHGVELVRVTLLTLRSEPELASELCFKDNTDVLLCLVFHRYLFEN